MMSLYSKNALIMILAGCSEMDSVLNVSARLVRVALFLRLALSLCGALILTVDFMLHRPSPNSHGWSNKERMDLHLWLLFLHSC